MDVRIGWANFIAQARVPAQGKDSSIVAPPYVVNVGWAGFETSAATLDVQVGWAEFDTTTALYGVAVGWAELDVKSRDSNAIPPFVIGDDITRYYCNSREAYEIPVDANAGEEEEIIMAILMEISTHVL